MRGGKHAFPEGLCLLLAPYPCGNVAETPGGKPKAIDPV
jgi:hypothetical protein